MAAHVSMMDDSLIAQLPENMLRACMRRLVATCPNGSKLLSASVKKQIVEHGNGLPAPAVLLSPEGHYQQLKTFLALFRCLISCHAAQDCLVYLAHLFSSTSAVTPWNAPSELSVLLEQASGDAVQAMQSIKESPSLIRDEKLLSHFDSVVASARQCQDFCKQNGIPFPFSRAALSILDTRQTLFPTASTIDRHIFQSQQIALDVTEDVMNGHDVESVDLGKVSVPRLFNGLWQMSSATAWGSSSADNLDAHLLELVKAGFTATDMADHYGDAELVYGSFRNRLPPQLSKRVVAATKWCVFKGLSGPATEELVLGAVQERCQRLGGRADLLQFHWQDNSNEDYLFVIECLVKLTRTRPDLLSEVGLVNFDAQHTEKVCKYMLERTGQVGIVSNQVQFSLVDSRPLHALCSVCETYGVKLLTYGSFCGGFLSDRWLNKPIPDVYDPKSKLTPSQRKYLDMILEWSDWKTFQELLNALRTVADRHGVDISNVATRWVLQQAAVGIVIVGTRLGVSSNAESNLKTFSFELDALDVKAIQAVATLERSRSLFDRIGDCGAEYR